MTEGGTMRRLIAAGLLVGGLLVTQASACVGVGPPAPPVTLLDSCHVPASLWSYYTFHVGGDAKTAGYVWLHTASGDSEAAYVHWGDIFQGYAVGPGWLYFAPDLDDNGAHGVSAPGGQFNPPTKECVG